MAPGRWANSAWKEIKIVDVGTHFDILSKTLVTSLFSWNNSLQNVVFLSNDLMLDHYDFRSATCKIKW